MSERINVVRDYGASQSHCVYCRQSSRFCTHGMMTSTLTVQAYQDLVDIGWTRAGYYMYKPDLSCMCCPSYTVRLNVHDFVPSKNQKKAQRKLQKYLDGGALSPKPPTSTPPSVLPIKTDPHATLRRLFDDIVDAWCKRERLNKGDIRATICPPTKKQRKHLPQNAFLTSPFLIALFHRLRSETHGWTLQHIAERFCLFFNETKQTIYQRWISEDQQHRWSMLMEPIRLRSADGHLNMFVEGGRWDEQTASELLLSVSVPRDPSPPRSTSSPMSSPSETSTPYRYPPDLPIEFRTAVGRRRHLTTHWMMTSFVEEEFELYRKYQMRIHDEPFERITRPRYERFLVDSPLVHEEPDATISPLRMGCYHVQYRIDGRLVAVGVVDVLPRSLCSAYFFWDPDFAPLSLGKISALMEIEWVESASTVYPTLKYYSIGYYVHSCAKIQYKGDYRPTELLCPETCLWVKITDDIRRRLCQQPYLVLSKIPGAECEENVALIESKADEKSSIQSQSLLLFDEHMTFGKCLDRLNAPGMDDRWSEIQRKRMEWTMPLIKLALGEWRKKVMRVADQLIYSCLDFVPDP